MLRIAIVAHGRFHAFDLARELSILGHDVWLFSNYPGWAVARFGIGRSQYRGHWLHGAVERLLRRVAPGLLRRTEPARHRWFGRWAARALEHREWDVVHCWSGVSEELLESRRLRAGARVLVRGSAHIVDQAALLADEERRVGLPVERPDRWMIQREQREYERADHVVVLSEFARASFARHGLAGGRVSVLPLGVDVDAFRPSPEVVQARADRVRRGEPLRVLFVGALSARKGLHDLVAVARLCADLPMTFTLVGATLPETGALLAGAGPNVIVPGRRDQRQLPATYGHADIFFFPTIEDGFGMVLTQAAAAGLPIVATVNCAAPDMFATGVQGWAVPVRDCAAMAGRLRWAHEHRAELADMMVAAVNVRRPASWAEVAEAFAARAAGRQWSPKGIA